MPKKKPKIPLIPENDASKEDHKEALLSIIRTANHSKYLTPDIVHGELLFRSDSLARIISEIKSVQWKVTNYSVVLGAALIGICKLIDFTFRDRCLLTLPSLVFAVLIGSVQWFSLRMIRKTEADLLYYRSHMKLNESLLSKTSGIVYHANEYVKLDNEALKDRPDFTKSARENYIYFTNPFYIVIIISGIITASVIGYLLWNIE